MEFSLQVSQKAFLSTSLLTMTLFLPTYDPMAGLASTADGALLSRGRSGENLSCKIIIHRYRIRHPTVRKPILAENAFVIRLESSSSSTFPMGLATAGVNAVDPCIESQKALFIAMRDLDQCFHTANEIERGKNHGAAIRKRFTGVREMGYRGGEAQLVPPPPPLIELKCGSLSLCRSGCLSPYEASVGTRPRPSVGFCLEGPSVGWCDSLPAFMMVDSSRRCHAPHPGRS